MQSKSITNQLSIFHKAAIVFVTLIVLASLTVSSVFAFETAGSSPSTATTPGKSWTSISYSFASDNLYAVAKKSNKQVRLGNFAIPGIPGHSTIDGIVVTVEGKTTGLQANVALSYDGGSTFTPAVMTSLTASESVNTLGSSTNTWGRTWNAGEFTNSKFVVKLTTTGATGNGIAISVDQVQVKVYYTPPPTTLTLAPVSGAYAGTAPMSATLTLTADSSPIPSKTISFYLNGTGIDSNGDCTGTWIGDATTLGDGTATLANANLSGISAGDYPYGACASFGGDANYQATSLSNSLKIIGTDTTLTTAAASGTYGGNVNLSATLTFTNGGAPINNQWINFYLFGNFVGNAKTNNSGLATLSNISVSGYDAGVSNDIGASFPGNADLNPANASALITINPRALTVTSVSDTKTYDGTTSSSGVPTITSGTLLAGDTASFLQAFANKDAGSGKSLIPSGAVEDGNSGLNYSPTFVPVSSGVINKSSATAKADDKTKFVGSADPAFTASYSGLIAGETGSVIDVAPTCSVAVAHTAVGTYSITCAGGSDNNYNLSYASGTLTVGNTAVYIGGSLQGSYILPVHDNLRKSYVNTDSGPVNIQSISTMPVVASERVAYSPDGGTTWTSYSELMGMPANQVSTSYTFPWYNNVDINSQLRFGNVGSASTTVTVTVGGVVKGNYVLAPNASQRASYVGLNAGPVKVTSSGNVPIIASLRVAYNDGTAWTSFSEMMGLPSSKLTTSYTFPWYNNVDLNSQLRFGNVGAADTTINVIVGGQLKGSYTLKPNESTRVSYSGLNNGPVTVTSSGGVPIIASMRVAYYNGSKWTDFSEMMGMPTSSLSTSYSFPVYNNVNHNTQVRFGNVGTATTTVTVTIGGVLRGSYTLAPNQSTRISYVGLDSGPIVISSSGGVKIIASERVAYFDTGIGKWTSFSEWMGLAKEQLTNSYLFPWYNDKDLNTELRYGAP